MKPNKYWFTPKTHGYGITPISWEGWLCTIGLAIVIMGIAYLNNYFDQSEKPKGFQFIGEVIIISLLFLHFSKPRTNGKIAFRWGKSQNKVKKFDE